MWRVVTRGAVTAEDASYLVVIGVVGVEEVRQLLRPLLLLQTQQIKGNLKKDHLLVCVSCKDVFFIIL